MKSFNLKKLVAMALTVATVTAVSPMAASAAWKQDAKGWWNTEGNSWSIGWRLIGGNWYHFDQSGYMSTGWINDNGTWYFAAPSGEMKTGWVIDYSAGYGQWYYLQPSGAMKTGWIQDNGKWYFLQPSGAMKTGWINDNGTWYFASESGAMVTGVIKVDGKTYYLQANGAMATGEVVINGVKYTFAANGACIGDAPKADKVFGTTGSGNNSGNSSNDNNGGSNGSSSSGSSGGGSGSSSSSKPAAVKDYSNVANITVEKTSENTYKVTFNQKLDLVKDTDYVVRDLYVTNEDATITKENDGSYLVKVTESSKLSINGVAKVIRDGKVYYVTGSKTVK